MRNRIAWFAVTLALVTVWATRAVLGGRDSGWKG